ncbi:MAG: Gp138 family membrane-puncturing spike protein [Acinetobacter sp.]
MDATQTELLEQAKENAMMDVRVSMPARIVSFDPATKTAQVEICMQMVDDDDSAIEYPPLVDCPCLFTRGGGFHVVHPYSAGDSGLVLFSDRCLDGWFESGKTAPPMDFRVHSMSDAYFIGGADHLGNVSPIVNGAVFIGKDDNSAGLQINADGSLILKGASLQIEPPVTTNSTITANGQITANGKPLDGHSHGGVERGSSNTDPL